ncbi:hypothetical protein ColLi_02455 [Colletotrichum liriopes]|uniref:Uncharacterized protein n=1 Tax=Colletotrichum liriopes TaxID=708192 RepID=A0AA37LPR9_9PEZI|nr:hypothetical protein ColLi_02455 [Colletotrichum liriopes]
MTSSRPNNEKAAKDANHVEDTAEDGLKSSEAVVDAALRGQVISGYETLSIWETVKLFKVATASCFAAAFSAATDGYQIGRLDERSLVKDL